MKKISFLSLISIILFFSLSGVAFAAYGIHGTFIKEAIGCLLCHRDHAASALVAGESNSPVSSLINTTNVFDTCTTCHGVAGIGANTNVLEGVYQLRTPLILDESISGATLNAGGFEKLGGPTGNPTLSSHAIDEGTYTAWGGGTTGPGTPILMQCTSCHDPHGSSNYRILLDTVNGLDRTGYVASNETNFPEGGFIRHPEEDTYFYGDYVPDFTTPKYKIASSAATGMSGWCTACHTQYLFRYTLAYDPEGTGTPRLVVRHRVNVGIGEYKGRQTPLTTTLPLETAPGLPSSLYQIGCLTCHRAHGTDRNVDQVVPNPSPAGDSTLLRLSNRGVCQNCHQK